MEGHSVIPPDLVEELNAAATSVFSRAIGACNASSSLVHMDSIRNILRDTVETAFARALSEPNARLSLQNRLPPELWLNVWCWLPFNNRFSASQVCSYWRKLAVDCAELWTLIDGRVEEDIAPDGSAERYSSLGLLPMALERARGMDLTLSVSLDPRYGEHHMDRLCAMLVPHAHQIVSIGVYMCSTRQLRALTKRLRPLEHLRIFDASLCVCWMATDDPDPLPLVFTKKRILPLLKVLMLPNRCAYAWPAPADRLSGALTAHHVLDIGIRRFPAVERLAFTPARRVDIIHALHDCPNVTTIFLDLAHFLWTDEAADLDPVCLDGLDCLYFQRVPVQYASQALGLVSAPQTQCTSVILSGFPSQQPIADQGEASPNVITTGNPSTTEPPGAARSFSAKHIYRRVLASTKRALRRQAPGELSAHNAVTPEIETPDLIPVADTEPSFVHSSLQAVSAHIAELEQAVHVDLHTGSSGHGDWISLEMSDSTERARLVFVQQHDAACMTRILSHIWAARVPLAHLDRVTIELELLPLLLASLPEAELPCLTVLDLRIAATVPSGSDDTTKPVSLAQLDSFSCPAIQELRLRRRGDPSERILLSAQDMVSFFNGPGARLPLGRLKLGRGIVVDDTTVLEGLALAVIFE